MLQCSDRRGLVRGNENVRWERNLGGRLVRAFASMRVSRDLETGMQRKFFEDVVHVTLDGVGRDMKSTRDFLIAEAVRNKADDLSLTSGHPHCRYGLTSFDCLS